MRTKLIYQDPDKTSQKKAYFEVLYASVIKIDKEIQDKKTIEKIILVDLQNKIFKNVESAFLNLIHSSHIQKKSICSMNDISSRNIKKRTCICYF